MASPERTHVERLRSILDIGGKRLLDVGCGNGAFLAEAAGQGAVAVGIEIDPARVEATRQALAGRAQVECGRGESLPFPDASFDLVCFVFSFHHVPADIRRAAIAEVRRVLRADGRMHVIDPLPFGPMTEVLIPVDDEREVRREAQALLETVGPPDFERRQRSEYEIARRFDNCDQFIARVVAADPSRRAKLATARPELEQRFAALSEPADCARLLRQGCVSFHFARC